LFEEISPLPAAFKGFSSGDWYDMIWLWAIVGLNEVLLVMFNDGKIKSFEILSISYMLKKSIPSTI
jgi:hypothetical protein